MSKQHLTLIIPGLLDAVARDQGGAPRLPALETLLARSDHDDTMPSTFYQAIARLFDLEPEQAGCVAAVSHFAETGVVDERVWMHVTPTYVFADKDRLILQGQRILELQQPESDQLIAELNQLYEHEPWQFEALHPERWYLALDHEPACRFTEYTEALGRSIEPFMPHGLDQAAWHRVMNEIQMMLHAVDVNQQRQSDNRYPVNSVWCWGVGRMPEAVGDNWQAVYSDDLFTTGLAMLAGAEVHGLPKHVETLLNCPERHCHQLVVFTPQEEDLLNADADDYHQRLQSLEQNWFEPLYRALKKGQLASLHLWGGDGHCYLFRQVHRWRFWRSRKPL